MIVCVPREYHATKCIQTKSTIADILVFWQRLNYMICIHNIKHNLFFTIFYQQGLIIKKSHGHDPKLEQNRHFIVL